MMLPHKILEFRNALSTRAQLARTTLQTLPRNASITFLNRNTDASCCAQNNATAENAGDVEVVGFG